MLFRCRKHFIKHFPGGSNHKLMHEYIKHDFPIIRLTPHTRIGFNCRVYIWSRANLSETRVYEFIITSIINTNKIWVIQTFCYQDIPCGHSLHMISNTRCRRKQNELETHWFYKMRLFYFTTSGSVNCITRMIPGVWKPIKSVFVSGSLVTRDGWWH